MTQSMSSEQQEKERRKRASRPKVRTGCVTCKTRHKKCDEGRPSCSMCTSSGRKCQYIETPDRRTRAARMGDKVVRVSRNSLPSGETGPAGNFLDGQLGPTAHLVYTGQVDLTPDERWYLDFFRKSTSLQCAGYFYDEFWQRLVHQVSEVQPAVCHAVIGMGSLNYRFVQLRKGESQGPLDRSFSLQQCNKAIACLRQNLMDNRLGRLRVEIALITCIVLVSIILFQEDAESAGRHLRSGYKLLGEYLRDDAHRSSTSRAVAQAFAGIHLVWSTFTNPDSFTENEDRTFPFFVPKALPETVDNIEKAGNFLVILARMVLRRHPRGFSVGPASSDLGGEPYAVLSKLRVWRSQIKGSLILHNDRLSQRDLDTLTLLEIWSEILYIILFVENGPLPRETRYDEYLPRFQKAVELAKKLLASDSSQNPLPAFSVNMGVIPPLFFCVFKCRDWLVRQEALLLLRQWQRQEGIWSTCATALVLKRVIEIETDGLTPEDLIPEESRIDSINVEITPDDPSLCLRYRRSHGQEVTAWASEWLPYESAKNGDIGMW
ncbi:uncharacterized protein N7482_000099 [Penicillium canariense]|uniref:Zn(2)-C6 fungal-type domain-containing protein n=1 Tax=Penicillium canariense TaxID=189055 RepID=A0A9W9IDA5_9EURO|nr:uncharacterized protein N7482_000099 [Penicillium canariense]KAJ5174222.1 hypothetical protein N7482_000099 [Penicillium canariense]